MKPYVVEMLLADGSWWTVPGYEFDTLDEAAEAWRSIPEEDTPHRLAASAWDTCPDLHILTTFFLSSLETLFFLDIQNAPFSAFSAFFTVRFEGSISFRDVLPVFLGFGLGRI